MSYTTTVADHLRFWWYVANWRVCDGLARVPGPHRKRCALRAVKYLAKAYVSPANTKEGV